MFTGRMTDCSASAKSFRYSSVPAAREDLFLGGQGAGSSSDLTLVWLPLGWKGGLVGETMEEVVECSSEGTWQSKWMEVVLKYKTCSRSDSVNAVIKVPRSSCTKYWLRKY